MARALSSSPLLSSLLSDATALLTTRRGYSVAAVAVRRNSIVEEKAAVSSFIGSKRVNGSDSGSNTAGSWIPDPITGYYRPANQAVERDAVELREMLLARRV